MTNCEFFQGKTNTVNSVILNLLLKKYEYHAIVMFSYLNKRLIKK